MNLELTWCSAYLNLNLNNGLIYVLADNEHIILVGAADAMSYQELDSPSPRGNSGPRRIPTTSASVGIDDNAVAEYLLSKNLYLVALELHQELLENNNGIHNIGILNSFFGEADNYTGILRQTNEKIKRNQNNCKRSPRGTFSMFLLG